MMRVDAGRVVVSGAGGGIGLGLVREFAHRGFGVVALLRDGAKRADLDEAIVGVEHLVEVQELDVRDTSHFKMPRDVAVLINNAGIRYDYLPVEEIGMDEWRNYFDVNFFGVVALTQLAIPLMRDAGRGIICNINSSSLFFPMPFLGPYRATKGAMAALTETLRAELAPFNIHLKEIFPGPVATSLSGGGILHRTPAAASFPPYAPMAQRQRNNQKAANLTIYSTAEVAPAMVDHILDTDNAMRDGTCAMSRQGLESWRPGRGGEPVIAGVVRSLQDTPS
ncbi:NAD(P)-dependent dehydrogenase (short-subunit alcohol dehydrogenase family) [Sphingobium sp. OAS761]|uniref:SDR family NAD(P)-dependent oxidoreductase n=1 Tax=Sphingobium sp. OAS761 TaxID=2817901 RepID=UPI00209D5A3E|nr:SDR family NAD(P)-dependent oxidoreductase [Sphingobium sp. OAS761]MCP1472410.1 NAD(P)-dependent dehydrogenase (short-subunit alcohol dehydrogenase family) [Sphingobium sp. OAS761]